MSERHQSTHEVAERTRRVERGKTRPKVSAGSREPARDEAARLADREPEQLQPDGR